MLLSCLQSRIFTDRICTTRSVQCHGTHLCIGLKHIHLQGSYGQEKSGKSCVVVVVVVVYFILSRLLHLAFSAN